MKMRLGPLLGVGIGYLIGSGKGKELIEKAKQSFGSGAGSSAGSMSRPYAPPMSSGAGVSGSGMTSGSTITGASSSGLGNVTHPSNDASVVVPAGISGTATPASLLEP